MSNTTQNATNVAEQEKHDAVPYSDRVKCNEPLTLTERLQQKCVEWGTYWRAPDAHGVALTHEQALELLRDALGVEVEFTAAQACPGGCEVGLIGDTPDTQQVCQACDGAGTAGELRAALQDLADQVENDLDDPKEIARQARAASARGVAVPHQLKENDDASSTTQTPDVGVDVAGACSFRIGSWPRECASCWRGRNGTVRPHAARRAEGPLPAVHERRPPRRPV